MEGCIISTLYHDSIILGAGASGLMTAYKYRKRDIALIDANPKIAAKLKISGGGKCNVTNTSVTLSNFYGDGAFVQKSLETFSRDDLLAFLKEHGVKPVIRKNQYYFCKDSSDEIIQIFQKTLKHRKFYLNQTIMDVKKEDDFIIKTTNGTFRCKNLIVATGGLSYPRMGASDIGHTIAKQFGHTIVTPKPALVGLTVQREQFWFKELSGLSTVVKIKVSDREFQDDLLFTHKGISGPVVLNASLYWDKGELEVDFVPALSLQRLHKVRKRDIPLPKRFLNAFLERYPIEMLKAYRFAPAGNFGYTKAEATRGGIHTDEINPENMMSLKEQNLYFIGECLNVTGELGGYNFQWAFSSAQNVHLRG